MRRNHEAIRREADRLLEAAGVSRPPVPLRDVVSVLNLSLVETSRDPFSSEAALVPLGDSHAIEVHGSTGARRQRFTIAHEIGHFVLHPGRARSQRDTSRGASANLALKGREREADIFAAELLMPEHLVRQAAFESGADARRLAEVFDVSVQAMSVRLARLGLAERSSDLLPPARDVL